MRILVFDSGVGGVGVAAEIRRVLPGATVGYLMDDAGFPYGAKSDAAVLGRVMDAVAAGIRAFLPDIVVVACNTASTVALAALRARFGVAFVGCVPPVRWAARLSVTRCIGVLATPATVRGPYLRELARLHAPDCVLFTHGAARLAGLAEDRFAGRAVEVAAIAADLAGLMVQPGADGIDVVALGCTHYAWLLPELRAALPRAVTWLDPAPAVARQVARIAAFSPAGTRDGAFDGLVLRTGGETGGLVGPGWGAAGFTRAAGLLS